MTEPKKRRTVKQLVSAIQVKIDRDVELLNKQSSEVDTIRGQLDWLGKLLKDNQARFDSATATYGEILTLYRERSTRVESLRDLLKDFEKNGDE